MTDENHMMIKRRWTDGLDPGSTSVSALATIPNRSKALSVEKERFLTEQYEEPEGSILSAQDFEVADIAREQLQKIVDKFDDDAKPSRWHQFGMTHSTRKEKAAEVIRTSMNTGIDDLKTSIDNLEISWKEEHGTVYRAFKKICNTLDDHRSILKVFPSQNDYASPLVGSVTILMKAAKSHSEISQLLSNSIAAISDKVATCSVFMNIITTSRTRRRLADIYARMLKFYQRTLEWYLQTRFDRFMRSFNENLLNEFEEARHQLDESVTELYREAGVANSAMLRMLLGQVTDLRMELSRQRKHYEVQDALSGQRMQKMMQLWSEKTQLERLLEKAVLSPAPNTEIPPGREEISTDDAINDDVLQSSIRRLDDFIIDENSQGSFTNGRFWVTDKETVIKLHSWTQGDSSRTIWITSPYEAEIAMPSSRAAAMATVAAAWQAETPIISAICKRVRQDKLRSSMSTEEVGLISLTYDLIRQLLQFSSVAERVTTVKEEDLKSLNGEASTWDNTLRILKALLAQVPDITFCVIDGLNELELGKGGTWCKQLLGVLMEKQQQTQGSFNILFSTSGQSYVLPYYVDVANRHRTSKSATEASKAVVFH